jgi:phenylacetate-CoA ligase
MNSFIARHLIYYPITMIKGEFVSHYLKKCKAFQWLPKPKASLMQLSAINSILSYAFNNSPFYNKLYRSSQLFIKNGTIQIEALEDLSYLPTISKADLINYINRISKKKLLASTKTTGGSTGEPVVLNKTTSALARERAATWRAYEWAGLSVGDPQLRFWGVPHTRTARWKARITDIVSNRVRISAFKIDNENLMNYYNQALKIRPKYIYGYVSAIEQFAHFVCDNSLAPLTSLKSIITTSEVLSERSCNIIQKAFGVKVYNEYGCGEVGSIAHECEYGNMHIMSDNVHVEVHHDKEGGGSNCGDLVITDLHNRATPLIRYRIGDFGTISQRQCECGRTLPILDKIHGRAYDIIITPSGLKVHPEALIYIFEEIQSRTNAFRQFQAIQKSLTEFEVKIIPSDFYSEEIEKLLIEKLKCKLDSRIKFVIKKVCRLEREKSGKMRIVKSLLHSAN